MATSPPTDILIAPQLSASGIPKSDIILGWQFPDLREASGYAAA